VRVLDPLASIPDALALACLPETIAREYNWLPFHSEGLRKKLHIACTRQPGQQLESHILEVVNQRVDSVGGWSIQWEPQVNRSALIEAINAAYEGSYDLEHIVGQCSELSDNEERNFDDEQWPVVRLFNALVNDAVHRRATDIHLLPNDNRIAVRYRVDGQMSDRLFMPMKIWRVLLSRLKVLSGLDVTEHRRPQEGAFELCVHGKPQPIRSAFIPHKKSEKITLRLLRSAGSLPALAEILVIPSQHQILLNLLKKRHGLIVVAGATGSGKTTTLYGCLMHWLEQGLNLITLEDPIEVPLPSVCQSEINASIGYSFSEGLKAALRHDPDGLLVGEIRDSETCALAIRSALSGHPVLASVHANNASGVFQRLIGLGATLSDLQQCVSSVIVQRLARTPCVCSRHDDASPNLLCCSCYGSGYSGCVAAVEIFQPCAEFFDDSLAWVETQADINEEFKATLQMLLSCKHIDQLEYQRMVSQIGGTDAQVSNSSD